MEDQIAELRQEWQGIPDLIEARLKLADSRVAALSSDMSGVKRTLGELRGEVQALPRVLADMLAERGS